MARKRAKHAGGGANLFALLIACDFYLPNRLPEGSYTNLGGCVRDVEHVEAFLRRRLGLTDDRLVKLTSTDGGGRPKELPPHRPTYENMVEAFRAVTRLASKGDQVYVHYSGHGGRTPTIVPKAKGRQALDEAFVPIDIGNESARYLRDVEIAKLLQEMVDKGLVVTAVFDCCHSGGAARAAAQADGGLAVRGVSFVDATPRPTESLVGGADELAKALPEAGSRGLGAQAQASGYTLLAACRPSESAYEFAFDGAERNGALTYWLLKALQQLSPEMTYRMVYGRLLARIHAQFEKQTPLLQGDPDRAVFGTVVISPEFATRVLQVAAGGKSIRLGAGQANLIRAGTEFAVYPNGTRDFTKTEKRTAVVRVRDVAAAASWADVVQAFGGEVQPGDDAVLLGAPSQKLVRKVRLERADGKPPGARDKALKDVIKALPGNGWVEAASPGDAADLVVRLSADGSRYEVCDGDGQPLALRPDVAAGDAATVVKRLAHLARYRAVRELDNIDPYSPLKGKLVVKFLGTQDEYDYADRPAPKPFPAGRPAELRVGQWTFLSVENRSDKVLNVAVLDLQPDWGIELAHPQGTDLDFTPLDPGREPLVIPLKASLPEGYDEGTDTLKVLATVEPTSFGTLVLPALDQPALEKGARRSAGPLDALLEALTAEKPPSRHMTPATAASRGWAVEQVEVRVTGVRLRRPRGRRSG